MAAAGDPHATDLHSFYQYVNFQALPPGQFQRVRRIAEGINGRIYRYQWLREGERLPADTPAMLELDQAIDIVQRGVDAGDDAEFIAFTRGLPDGGGYLRSTLATRGFRGGAWRTPPDLEAILAELQQSRAHLEGQLQDVLVVVKVMPGARVHQNDGSETNERRAYFDRQGPPPAPYPEDAMTEIGVLARLRALPNLPVYLLRLLGVFMEGENVMMVTEFIDSELFNQVANGPLVFPEDRVMRYNWQLLQAVRYLHANGIGHRDISLENILVTFGDDVDGQIRLMDFGQAVLTHSPDGVALRYFTPCGKQYYRAPECYVPRQPRVFVVPPQNAAPREVVMARLLDNNGRRTGYACQVRLPAAWAPGQPVAAEVWGYEAILFDMFSCGVALFILAFQAPPWQQALLSDQGFNWIQGRGPGAMTQLVTRWQRTPLAPEAMTLLESLIALDPTARPSAEECLQNAWFAPMNGVAVPMHRADVVAPAGAAAPAAEAAVAPADAPAEAVDVEMDGGGAPDAGAGAAAARDAEPDAEPPAAGSGASAGPSGSSPPTQCAASSSSSSSAPAAVGGSGNAGPSGGGPANGGASSSSSSSARAQAPGQPP